MHRLSGMNLIILTENDFSAQNQITLTDHRAEHIINILKANVGDPVEVGLLNSGHGTAIIEDISGTKIVMKCGALASKPSESSLKIDLICALPRPQTLKKVLIISAMMGVRNLFLIRANRVEKSYFHSPLLEPDNYTQYLLEGLSQGKLTKIPEVSFHDRFKPFFEDYLPSLENFNSKDMLKLIPEQSSKSHLDQIYNQNFEQVIIAIGPEGGWVPFEIDLMQDHRFLTFTLGDWTLRVEHAVTSTLAQLELVRNQNERS